MKKFLMATVATLVVTAPGFADSTAEVEALLAMSNNSAAEIMLNETSTGNVDRAQMRFALGNMSAAEREAFFSTDEETRAEILNAQVILMNGDSAAEAKSN